MCEIAHIIGVYLLSEFKFNCFNASSISHYHIVMSSVCSEIAFSVHVHMSKIQEKHQWIHASNGHAPAGTLVGGHDVNGEPIYVARALHGGDLIPGKLVASQRCAYISFGGLEFKKDEYEVLVGGPNNWIATNQSDIPDKAFPGGKTQSGETLYIGRVHYQETITTGKVQKSEGVCYIPFDHKELHFIHYETLTY